MDEVYYSTYNVAMGKSHPGMGNTASKRHHYLPRYYLKGFTNSDNRFFVYDKEEERIFVSSPDAAFFENNLNTVTFPKGDSSDFLEDMYTESENQSWGSLDRIRESTCKTPIALLDKMHIFLFLLFLYWRLPSNIAYVETLSEKAFVDGGEFDYFSLVNKSGQRAPKEVTEMLKNSQAFKKTFRQIIPFIPFYKDKDWAARLEKWRFLYTADDKSWYIVGDTPIVAKGDNEHDFVNCLKEFMFPVSGKILLINIDKPINQGLPPEFVVEFNTAIIQQARRFVACQNKGFLEALIKYYKFYAQYDKTSAIIPDLFEMLW
jgi:hypothetical protein